MRAPTMQRHAAQAKQAQVPLDALQFMGDGLDRAECVLTTASGDVFCSDRLCGVVQVGAAKQPLAGRPDTFLPNGFAILPGREFLVANLDAASGGGIWKIDSERQLRPWLLEADGESLRVSNSICRDRAGRHWVSVATRRVPREQAFRAEGGDGFIVLDAPSGARIVADGIGFTNECRADPREEWLYVNETFARRLSRFRILANGDLGAKETVTEFSRGDFPDGVAFDAEGHAWVACVVSNRIVRVAPGGRQEVMLDASDPDIVASAECSWAQGRMGRADVDSGGACVLGNSSSLAFGGADLRQVVLGTLANTRLATFRSPVAGAEPPHWNF